MELTRKVSELRIPRLINVHLQMKVPIPTEKKSNIVKKENWITCPQLGTRWCNAIKRILVKVALEDMRLNSKVYM